MFPSIVRAYVPKVAPKHEISYHVIHSELVHIKYLLDCQTTVFRRQNHPTLDQAFADLMVTLEQKTAEEPPCKFDIKRESVSQ
jgi:hypothetical protein